MLSSSHFIEWDHKLSECLVGLASSPGALRWKVRQICLLLEWTMHGVPWLVGTSMAALWSRLRGWPEVHIGQIDTLLLGLLLDLAVVGLVKIAARRSRPEWNRGDQFYEAPIADKFSFPSGHAARAAMVSTILPSTFWAMFTPILAVSRVLLGRHFVSDAIAGIAIGRLEALLVLAMPDGTFRLIHKFAECFCTNWNGWKIIFPSKLTEAPSISWLWIFHYPQ